MQDLRLGAYAAGGTMAPHAHEQSSFTVVLHGSYHERICGRSVEHRPGSMLFYPAGETHSQQFGPDGSRKLIFRPNSSCLDLLAEGKVPLEHAPHVRSTQIRQLANRAAREMRDGDSFSPMVIEGSMLEMVAAFGRMCEMESQGAILPNWLKQCREMLEAQPGVAASHEALALQVNKHPVHLAKAFRSAYGETIGDCQRRLRLSKAESLLQTRKMSLLDISMECGYSNQAHFTRSFKCAFGTTPGRYRQLH